MSHHPSSTDYSPGKYLDNHPLRFPIVYFNHNYPTTQYNVITAIASSGNGKRTISQYLLTGNSLGELFHYEAIPTKNKQISNTSVNNFNSNNNNPNNSNNSSANSSSYPVLTKYRARSLLVRIGSSCITTIRCLSALNNEYFSVSTSSGYLSLWNASGGRCVRSNFICSHPIQIQQAFYSNNRKQCFLAVANYTHSLVYIVSLPKLSVVKILNTEQVENVAREENKSPSNNVSEPLPSNEFTVLDTRWISLPKSNYLLVLYSYGYVSLYDTETLIQSIHNNSNLSVPATKTFHLSLECTPNRSFPFALCVNENIIESITNYNEFVVVLMHKSVAFLNIQNCTVVCLYDIRNIIGETATDDIIMGSSFVASDRLAVYTTTGKLYLFHVDFNNSVQLLLISTTHLDLQNSEPITPTINEESEIKQDLPNIEDQNRLTRFSSDPSISRTISSIHIDSHTEKLYCGHENGTLSIYSLASNTVFPSTTPSLTSSISFNPASNPFALLNQPLPRSLSAQYSSFNCYQIVSIMDSFPAPTAELELNPISSSLLFQSLNNPLLVYFARGYKYGNLIIHCLTKAISAIELQAHHATITALAAINFNKTLYLITAATDNLVKILDINTAKLIKTYPFNCNIINLYTPQTNYFASYSHTLEKITSPLVFAVLIDRSIRILDIETLSLIGIIRGLDSGIEDVFYNDWCELHGYVIVSLSNGTVSIYNVYSQLLETVLAPPVAQHFLQTQCLLNQHSQIALNTHKYRQSVAKQYRDAESTAKNQIIISATVESNGVSLHHKRKDSTKRTLGSSSSGGTTRTSIIETYTSNHHVSHPPQSITVLKVVLAELNKAENSRFLPPQFPHILSPLTVSERAEMHEFIITALGVYNQSIPAASSNLSKAKPVLEIINSKRNDHSILMVNIQSFLLELQSKYSMKSLMQLDSAASQLNSVLSLLFDWDCNSSTDSLLRDQLKLRLPSPTRYFAVNSDGSQALTCLFPFFSTKNRRWQIDNDFTAKSSLSINSVCISLLNSGNNNDANQTVFSKLFVCYNSVLPEQLKSYIEGDCAILALFALNIHESIHTAARMMLPAIIERITDKKRQQLTTQWAAYYNYPLSNQPIFFEKKSKSSSNLNSPNSGSSSGNNSPSNSIKNKNTVHMAHHSHTNSGSQSSQMVKSVNNETSQSSNNNNQANLNNTPVSDEELMTAMLLCFIGVYEMEQKKKRGDNPENKSNKIGIHTHTQHISDFEAQSQYITNTLLRLIATPIVDFNPHHIVKVSLACDLYSTGLLLFKQHISSPIPVLKRLHQLTQSNSLMLQTSAKRALLESGRIAPAVFVDSMGIQATNAKLSTAIRKSAILSVVELMSKYPFSLSKVLPSAVATIIRCLEPADPTLRKSLLTETTSALFELVKKYPSVAFHQETQRFAVGTGLASQCVIIVYDLRTATKWRILEGHKSEITAINFNKSGGLLVSYSALEQPPTLRSWNTSNPSFLSGLLGIQGKCAGTWKLPFIKDTSQSSMPKTTSSKSNNITKDSSRGSQSEGKQANSSSARNTLISPSTVYRPSSPSSSTSSSSSSSASSTLYSSFDEEDLSYYSASQGFGSIQSGSDIDSVASSIGGIEFAKKLLSVRIKWNTDSNCTLIRENGDMLQFNLNSPPQ